MKELIELAKEKGFEPVLKSNIFFTSCEKEDLYRYDLYQNSYLSELQKWLRDEHKIEAWANPWKSRANEFDGTYSFWVFKKSVWKYNECDFESYEFALIEGLKEALKYI